MAVHRPKAPCDLDVVEQALALFGSVNNAQRLLRLSLPYAIANAAFRGQPVSEEVNDAVTIAWRTWKQLYLRGLGLDDYRPDLTFRLPETIDLAYELMDSVSEEESAKWKRLKGRFSRMAEAT